MYRSAGILRIYFQLFICVENLIINAWKIRTLFSAVITKEKRLWFTLVDDSGKPQFELRDTDLLRLRAHCSRKFSTSILYIRIAPFWLHTRKYERQRVLTMAIHEERRCFPRSKKAASMNFFLCLPYSNSRAVSLYRNTKLYWTHAPLPWRYIIIISQSH